MELFFCACAGGGEFRGWVQEQYPAALLLYVPASFTAWLQPLDVSVNFPLKAQVTREATRWLANEVTQELLDGKAPDLVSFSTQLSSLKGPFCHFAIPNFYTLKKLCYMLSRLVGGINLLFFVLLCGGGLGISNFPVRVCGGTLIINSAQVTRSEEYPSLLSNLHGRRSIQVSEAHRRC